MTRKNAVGKGVNVCALPNELPLAKFGKIYLALAHTWLQLAAMFESDDARMKNWGETPSKVVPLASRRRRPIKLRAV